MKLKSKPLDITDLQSIDVQAKVDRYKELKKALDSVKCMNTWLYLMNGERTEFAALKSDLRTFHTDEYMNT